MRLLLDTHIIVWAANEPERLSPRAIERLIDPTVTLVFSAVNIWEVAIKRTLKRNDFEADPTVLRENLLTIGYEELPVTSLHTLELMKLPPIHKDPFDRLLVAQSISEGLSLMTSDAKVARYPGPILKV
jgi:PIN domain nuclease of toxin-antitoxin system